jgi:hypothetical protein
MKITIIFALLASATAVVCRAQSSYISGTVDVKQVVFRDTATVSSVNASSTSMVQVDSPTIPDSEYVRVESDPSAGFCCAFDVAASTIVGAGHPCSRASQTTAGSPWTWEVRRWAHSIKVFCQSLSTTASPELRVIQGR